MPEELVIASTVGAVIMVPIGYLVSKLGDKWLGKMCVRTWILLFVPLIWKAYESGLSSALSVF